MPLSSTTIAKFFRESFREQAPLQVDPLQREALGNRVRERLKGLEFVTVESNAFVREADKARYVCAFSIDEPSRPQYHWSGRRFLLNADDQRRLTIHSPGANKIALISSYEEIDTFVSLCRERVARRKAQTIKRQKVKNLRAQAVLAQVKGLARTEKFDFAADTTTRALKLYVKLSEAECVELDVPFKGFEQVLPHLREAILGLRALHQRGLKFRIRSLQGYRWNHKDWTSHESLEQ